MFSIINSDPWSEPTVSKKMCTFFDNHMASPSTHDNLFLIFCEFLMNRYKDRYETLRIFQKIKLSESIRANK